MSRANAHSSSDGAESAPNVKRRPPFAAEVISIACVGDVVRDELEAQRERPGVQRLVRVVLAQVERVLDQVLVAPGADDAAEAVARARRRVQHGRAGVSVPGQRSTGTGCWRGA